MAAVNYKELQAPVFQILEDSDAPNFIILFKGTQGRTEYFGLYSHDGKGNV